MLSNPIRLSLILSTLIAAACTSDGPSSSSEGGTGGKTDPASSGGTSGSGGVTASGGAKSSGGSPGSGGSIGSGGLAAQTGGTSATGGAQSSGGITSTGGQTPVGSGGMGRDAGQGTPGTGGAVVLGSGGRLGTGGRPGTGGSANGGSTSPGTGTSTIDCNATMPSGGSDHCGQNTQGSAGGLSWSLWSNTLSSSACITTYSTPAFSARWNNNGDFLARIGLEFGSGGKTYDQYGTIKADFAYKKTGTAGGYSYIGIYGWSTNPCVEWYIVDDRWGTMPFNAYNSTLKGTVAIDGADYKIFSN